MVPVGNFAFPGVLSATGQFLERQYQEKAWVRGAVFASSAAATVLVEQAATAATGHEGVGPTLTYFSLFVLAGLASGTSMGKQIIYGAGCVVGYQIITRGDAMLGASIDMYESIYGLFRPVVHLAKTKATLALGDSFMFGLHYSQQADVPLSSQAYTYVSGLPAWTQPVSILTSLSASMSRLVYPLCGGLLSTVCTVVGLCNIWKP